MSIKLKLVDNDYVVRLKTDLALNGTDDLFRNFIKSISEELVTGETAYLEIEGSNMDPMAFEISNFG